MTDIAQAGLIATPRGSVPLRWVCLVFAILAAFVYLTGLTASPADAGIAYQTAVAIAIVSVPISVIVFCVLVYRRYVGTPVLGWPGWRRFLREAVIAILIVIGWALVMSIAAWRWPELRRLTGSTGASYRPVIIAPVALCLVGFTAAPVAEEMLSRAVLYGSLRRWMRPVLAVVLQALVFGVMHPNGLLHMSLAFVAGLLFMGLYLWRRTLWSPVLVHGLINAASLIPLLVVQLAASGQMVAGISLGSASQQPSCTVTQVAPGSPAEDARLQVGDIITAIDHHPVYRPIDVQETIRRHHSGDTIQLALVRDGQTLDVAVTLRVRRPHILW